MHSMVGLDYGLLSLSMLRLFVDRDRGLVASYILYHYFSGFCSLDFFAYVVSVADRIGMCCVVVVMWDFIDCAWRRLDFVAYLSASRQIGLSSAAVSGKTDCMWIVWHCRSVEVRVVWSQWFHSVVLMQPDVKLVAFLQILCVAPWLQ